ncbi:MAG: hypothetical protein KAU20_05570 [Nanoarchaeota archaeon]|nr:hypothetical protein [Nanoarchaeota archaeon]
MKEEKQMLSFGLLLIGVIIVTITSPIWKTLDYGIERVKRRFRCTLRMK